MPGEHERAVLAEIENIKQGVAEARARLAAEGEAPANEAGGYYSRAVDELRTHDRTFDRLPLAELAAWADRRVLLEARVKAYERRMKATDENRARLQAELNDSLLALGRAGQALEDARRADAGAWQGSIIR